VALEGIEAYAVCADQAIYCHARYVTEEHTNWQHIYPSRNVHMQEHHDTVRELAAVARKALSEE
jgi:hypothetical protein